MIFIKNALQKIGNDCLIVNLKANNFFEGEGLRKEDFDQLFEVLKVAKNLDKFAIREIISITNRASMLALKDGRRDINADDYKKIIDESQNLKVKEERYKTNATRTPIGFKTIVGGPKTIS